jgi:hypothetical protein
MEKGVKGWRAHVSLFVPDRHSFFAISVLVAVVAGRGGPRKSSNPLIHHLAMVAPNPVATVATRWSAAQIV